MSWAKLLEEIKRAFRLSEPELASISGMTYPTLNRIRRGITKRPNQHTIKKLEDSLQIRIDDSDPENVTYKKINEQRASFEGTIQLNSYPLLNYIYAGKPEMLTQEPADEYLSVPYSKQGNCFGIKVIGDSMNGIVSQGDIAFVDMEADLADGCVVAVRLKTSEQIIKRFHRMKDNTILLTSDNQNYKPVSVHPEEIEAIYRVVKIIKDV